MPAMRFGGGTMTAKTGRGRARGERHGSAKLTDELVRYVRRLVCFYVPYRELTENLERFHGCRVSTTAIGKIVRRETWRHVQ